MYTISKHNSYGAFVPELKPQLCDLNTPPSSQHSLQSPSNLDHNYSTNSSISPSSFLNSSDDFQDPNDALLTQIINEYSDEEFPTFENINNEIDFNFLNYELNFETPFKDFIDLDNIDTNLFNDIDFNDNIQISPKCYQNISPNYQFLDQNNQFLDENAQFPNLNKNIYTVTNLQIPSLKIFSNFPANEIIKKRKTTENNFDNEVSLDIFEDSNFFNYDYDLNDNCQSILHNDQSLEQNNQVILERNPTSQKKIVKITNLSKHSQNIYSNFECFPLKNGNKRKRKSENTFDLDYINKLKMNDLQLVCGDDIKKIGNREAAHRYRQKMKVKVNEDERELDEAVREMKEAKRMMLEMRRDINTVKSLVCDMLTQQKCTSTLKS